MKPTDQSVWKLLLFLWNTWNQITLCEVYCKKKKKKKKKKDWISVEKTQHRLTCPKTKQTINQPTKASLVISYDIQLKCINTKYNIH